MAGEKQIEKVYSIIGLPACLEQLAEEAAELTQAALKLARVIRDENPTPVTYAQAAGNLVEEAADVHLCLMVLQSAIPIDDAPMMKRKLDRWLQRLGA